MFILHLTLKKIIIGMIIPFIMFYVIKKKNQKSVKQIKPKKILIIYYIVIFILYIVTIIVRLIHQNNLNESKPIPAPQIETKAEYYYKKNEYGHDITSTKYALTEEDKPYSNDEGKLMLANVGEISKPQIERKYTFFGFNGLDQCRYKDKVPKDLPLFIREPFNHWRYTGKMKPYNDSFMGRNKDYFTFEFDIVVSNRDSKFYPYGFVKQDETIEMDYKGPKYLLEKDEDFYINTVECPLQEEKKFETKHQNYYLHFNPVKKYITLYTVKKNDKEN
ncbi:hypothetical protein C6B37_02400 [Candidatus Phytoplasma phoenicium]|uniref:Effector n=1 Tax=Candidatus Phytoplasma phoenicium TaxID=198422 RepID=A0A2S8NT52_9MOLU|nr:hypothetical protein C6B37_02400 [Candidatus Phytoplasma phoenicium]